MKMARFREPDLFLIESLFQVVLQQVAVGVQGLAHVFMAHQLLNDFRANA